MSRKGSYVVDLKTDVTHSVVVRGGDHDVFMSHVAFINEQCRRGDFSFQSKTEWNGNKEVVVSIAYTFVDETDALMFKMMFG